MTPALDHIDDLIKRYYRLGHPQRASDFLITASELAAQGRDPTTDRGAVLLDQRPGEWFIGIFLSEEIAAALPSGKPASRQELDALSVAIEEISHFNFLLARLEGEQTTSLLELEWQGEIDRLLVVSLLVEGWGPSQLRAPLFDESRIDTAAPDHYREASHFAAKFWQSATAAGITERRNLLASDFIHHMQANYRAPLRQKTHYDGSHRRRRKRLF